MRKDGARDSGGGVACRRHVGDAQGCSQEICQGYVEPVRQSGSLYSSTLLMFIWMQVAVPYSPPIATASVPALVSDSEFPRSSVKVTRTLKTLPLSDG